MNTLKHLGYSLTLPVLTSLSAASLAHSGHGAEAVNISGSQLLAGFSHTLSGIDHLLALIFAGLLITQTMLGKGSKKASLLALAVVGAMLIGTVAGSYVGGAVALELLVSLSIVLMAGLLYQNKRLHRPLQDRSLAVIVAGVFALHGWAHGSEIPANGAAFFALGNILAALLTLTVTAAVASVIANTRLSHLIAISK